jgi:uncharacterized protein YndB with AHSA1/START domain
MKFLKYLLITLLTIIGIALIVAAFLPKTFHAEGKATINRPAVEVFDYVRLLKTQEQYSIWFEMDPNIQTTYTGTDGQVGGQLEWQSEEVGNGKQIIKKVTPNERVEIDLYLMDGKEANNYYYQLKAIDSQNTEVIMAVDGQTPYPFNLMGLFFDMNEAFQKSANNLKQQLEK